MKYGQFCPIAKASEMVGDKWTLLIIRELMMGGTRFNELQRGLSMISPTMLTKRLTQMCDDGLILKKKIPGQKGYEYFLTEAGRELGPILQSMSVWGMRWARGALGDSEKDDLDLELLMLYLERSIIPEKLIGRETVIRFKFTDLKTDADWWLVVKEDHVDACLQDPGKDVDIYFTTDLPTMISCWMGDLTYKAAMADKRMTVVGHQTLKRNIQSWLADAAFAGIPPARQIA
jgi:DNA-binding HxlR family transcriptional regulator